MSLFETIKEFSTVALSLGVIGIDYDKASQPEALFSVFPVYVIRAAARRRALSSGTCPPAVPAGAGECRELDAIFLAGSSLLRSDDQF